jgi:hypothetical protein
MLHPCPSPDGFPPQLWGAIIADIRRDPMKEKKNKTTSHIRNATKTG